MAVLLLPFLLTKLKLKELEWHFEWKVLPLAEAVPTQELPVHLQDLLERSSEEHTEEQRSQLAELLTEFQDVFARNECLDTRSGHVWFSKLNANSTFHQIKIRPEDQRKTAFVTRYGLYKFARMGFGICNAPATFFPDHDFGADFEDHSANLRRVIACFREFDLKFKLEKCALFQRRVEFLGSQVSPQCVEMGDSYDEAVWNWAAPRSTNDEEMFLVLALPTPNGEFVLDQDKSSEVIEAELFQIQDGQKKTIAYGSLSLCTEQRIYCTIRKELLSVLSQYHIVIQHRPGRRQCNADALSRLPVPPGGCGTRLDVHTSDMPCGDCPKCKRPHDNWNAFAEVVNDVGLLSKPGCWSCKPDMGEFQNPEISEADAGGEESGADLAVESVIRQPSISEITLGDEFVLVMVDQLTKLVECIPLSSQTVEVTDTAAVNDFFSRFGCPFQIFTNQVRNLENKLFRAVCELLQVH
uniref:Uncharacterized protein LOC111109068 n=1 Tax=Crassostrea virginica TaxID=6565 RepID=A0A8B8BBR3_CRAVI|nr:uncharacterized protein LOC111109068 [Crassostrea virginica]